MNNSMINIKSKLPDLNTSYSSIDIIGNTIGRYFDYKKDTAHVKHQTAKVKAQAKVICKNIDAQLKISLDENDKNFQKEMFRLKTISKSLKHDAVTKKEIIGHISRYIKMLEDPTTPMEIKANIPNLIAMAHKSLENEGSKSIQKLNQMSGFNPNTKLLKG